MGDAVVILLVVGILASLMPAARASHVDVMEALRSE
jgi:ABC-type lipoprotein release transport system permease subunit